MSETEPRRKFWRIHLSTVVLLVFVAGLFICENMQPDHYNSTSTEYGWPTPIFGRYFSINTGRTEEWQIGHCVLNAVVGVLIAASVASISELLIRRREAKNPNRRGFRFHLLTLLSLSVVAGPWLWINVAWLYEYPNQFLDNPRFKNVDCIRARGWPLIWQFNPSFLGEINFLALFVDAAVALAFLATTALICEWLIRRREARKT